MMQNKKQKKKQVIVSSLLVIIEIFRNYDEINSFTTQVPII